MEKESMTKKVKAAVWAGIVLVIGLVADFIGGITGQVIGDEAQGSIVEYIFNWVF